MTPSKQSVPDRSPQHNTARPALTPVVSWRRPCEYIAGNATVPRQPRILHTRLTTAHDVVGFLSTIGTRVASGAPVRPNDCVHLLGRLQGTRSLEKPYCRP